MVKRSRLKRRKRKIIMVNEADVRQLLRTGKNENVYLSKGAEAGVVPVRIEVVGKREGEIWGLKKRKR